MLQSLQALEERISRLEAERQTPHPHICDCGNAIQLLEEALCELIQQHEDLVEYIKQQHEDPANITSDNKEKPDTTPSFNDRRVSDVVERVVGKVKRMERERRLFAREMELLRQENRELMARWNSEDYRTGFELHYVGESQQDLEAEMEEIRGERNGLQDLVDSSKGELEAMEDKVARRFKDIESTISYLVRYGWSNPQLSGWNLDSDKDMWVPPTSEKPTGPIPYPFYLSLGRQPKGWAEARAEICRELEESQANYYKTRRSDSILKSEDEVIVSISDHLSTPNQVSKSRENKSILKKHAELTNYGDEPSLPVSSDGIIKQEPEVESAFRSLVDSGVIVGLNPHPRPQLMQGPLPQADIDSGLIEQAATMISSRRSRSPTKKQKVKSLGTSRVRPKQIPISQLFKPQKQRLRDESKPDS